MNFLVSLCLLSLAFCGCKFAVIEHSLHRTQAAKIDYKIANKPHHLFIGRCLEEHVLLHQENIIIKNDGKSQVSGAIRVNVGGPSRIACVNIYDEMPNGEGAYPSYFSGGIGQNFVEFNVVAAFGKGFHFFVQVYGYKNETQTAKKLQ